LKPSQTDSSQSRSDGRIAGLDGLRAISIVLVLIGHGSATIPSSYQFERYAPYLGNASLGVLTFFVISGYLITYLLRKEWEKTHTIRLQTFYLRRALRIFPAFYTYLLAIMLLRAGGWIDTTYGDIMAAGTYLTNYKARFSVPTNDDYWFVGHFWTLSLEEQFYLFWPATIFFLGLVRAPRAALLIVVATPIIRVASYFIWPSVRGQLGMMLHSAADPLMVGCLAALWQGHRTFEAVLNRFSSWIWPLLAAFFLLGVSPWLQVQFQGRYSMTIGWSLSAFAVVFILLWVVRNPESLLGRVLTTPVLRYIGILSYSLYLWQQLFLTTRNTGVFGQFPLNFVACFVAAQLSYVVVERPFLRLRDRFRRGRPSLANSNSDAAPLLADPDLTLKQPFTRQPRVTE
jgi:peptidoglycan/LPS O-acetylase OafA/YrhL